MNKLGRLLIADDEETFLKSTADLLRREGYECDCASDANGVLKMLKSSMYDLLITDINMPGNHELELLKELPEIAEGMPVILMTGNPSLNSAIESIKLTVVAYMVKPLELDELLAQVKISIERFRTYSAVHSSRQRLKEWSKELENIETLMGKTSMDASSVPISTFFTLTLRNIVDALIDLKHLTEVSAKKGGEQYVCNLFGCPRLSELEGSLMESIDVLNKTKGSFKSKDLGRLRTKLETLSRTMGK
ncbi:MAG: response regulator [Candidatus Scalindua sp.]